MVAAQNGAKHLQSQTEIYDPLFDHYKRTDEIMNKFEEDWYNSQRPHTYNNGLAPNQVYSSSTLL
ncbi:hypothetical protein MGH68_11840 [Erysipelothrix sp. D19-032]